jgi:integrase/recombinase XerC
VETRDAGLKQKTELRFTDLTDRYLLSKQAEGKSPATIRGYRDILTAFARYLGEHGHGVSSITREVADKYLLYLRRRPRFTGRRVSAGTNAGLAEESIRDHLRALKAFFSWLFEEGYVTENVFKRIKLGKPPTHIIQPLKDDEIITILDTIGPKTPMGQRNHVIVELMLDGGFRAGEIAGAKLTDLDLVNGTLKVMGKGSKERTVPLGRNVHAALLQYVNATRPKPTPGTGNLFLAKDKSPISVNTLKLLFSRLARKSGVSRLHAHLCRHTFAINYLMNGGDVFSLKIILGHESLEMVNRYLHFNTAQITARHREFSPMDRLLDNHRKE